MGDKLEDDRATERRTRPVTGRADTLFRQNWEPLQYKLFGE